MNTNSSSADLIHRVGYICPNVAGMYRIILQHLSTQNRPMEIKFDTLRPVLATYPLKVYLYSWF